MKKYILYYETYPELGTNALGDEQKRRLTALVTQWHKNRIPQHLIESLALGWARRWCIPPMSNNHVLQIIEEIIG